MPQIFGTPEWDNLLKRLKDNDTTLTDLNLHGGNQIEASGAQALSAALKDNRTLTHLNLRWNEIGDSGAQALSTALKVNRTLTHLDLDGNAIGASGAQALSAALKDNRTLTQLDLGRNAIGDSGAQALSAALKDNRTLTDLNLFDNKIGNSGAQALSTALKVNRTLTHLDLMGNAIGDSGAQALSAALKVNRTLTHLNLSFNDAIGVSLKSKIRQQLAANKAYQKQPRQASAPVKLSEPAQMSDRAPSSDVKAIASQQSHALPQPLGKQDLETEGPTQQATLTPPPLAFSFTIAYSDIQIDQELGRGGFGVVYQGTWRHTDVAIKQLHLAKPSEEALDEFQQEIAIMAKLRSPHIVALYGLCNDKMPYGIVMEYMAKGSLYQVLHSRTPLDWPLRQQMALDMAKGLAFLHAENILHRDFKSLNVLLDEHYRAKLSDFGLARIKTESKSISTKSTGGSIPWMGPELFQRRATYTPKSDIYSYGMVLWELASREIPFKDAHDTMLIPKWVAEGEREEIPSDTPPKVASLIRFCWQADPSTRPIADQVVAELKSNSPTPHDANNNNAPVVSRDNSNNNNNNNPGPHSLSNNYSFRPKT